MNHQQEGVIKFQLEYTVTPLRPDINLGLLNAWRTICYGVKLIGQDPGRYEGYGFGNISQRASHPAGAFVISGTQTGHFLTLTAEHYTLVLACQPAKNQVTAEGPIAPSSESMTHAILYQLDPHIEAVIHVHSPEIWLQRERLQLPTTSADVPYGTPAMTQEVARLFTETHVRETGLLAMAGHEDGVVAFGSSLAEAGCRLLIILAQALAGNGE